MAGSTGWRLRYPARPPPHPMLKKLRNRAQLDQSYIRSNITCRVTNLDTMNAPIAAPLLYPAVPEAALKSQYLGTNIQDLPTPAAIIDRAVATSNCADMLQAARTLGLEFRPHVKTHKVGHMRSPSIYLMDFRVSNA